MEEEEDGGGKIFLSNDGSDFLFIFELMGYF